MGLTSSHNPAVETTEEYKWVEAQVHEHPVLVFSKTTCSFCSDAKRLLNTTNVAYQTHEINKMVNCAQIQDALQHKTGARTVSEPTGQFTSSDGIMSLVLCVYTVFVNFTYYALAQMLAIILLLVVGLHVF